MKIALLIAAGLALLVAAVVIIGMLLPVGHTATRSAMFAQSAEGVYTVVRDVGRYPDWWDGVSKVEILDPVEGRLRFRQHTSDGPIVMEIVEDAPPSRLTTRIADPDQPFGGTWTFEVAPVAGGSQLTITERGEVYNPLFRFMARFAFGYTGTMESYLRALGRHFGQDVTIE